MKKTILALLLALLMATGSISVLAAEAAIPAQPMQAEDGGISPQAEETVWCVRVYEGRRQKRLWSITYERWLTDWIDLGPVIEP